MKKSEALEAMREGNKVTREHFSSDEYVYINEYGKIMSEDGFQFREWWDEIEPTIPKTSEDCWSIWKEPK